MEKPNILVVGSGGVGKGTLGALLQRKRHHDSINIKGLATRRPEKAKEELENLNLDVEIIGYQEPEELKGIADVGIVCIPSQTLWYHSDDGKIKNEEGPKWAKLFNVFADCYDNHGEMGKYAEAMEEASLGLASLANGFDPGYFSIHKNVEDTLYPNSVTNVFYGPGKSLGHTTALTTDKFLIKSGLIDAIQFTMPKEESKERLRWLSEKRNRAEIEKLIKNGGMQNLLLSPGERMWRDVYIQISNPEKEEEMSKYIQSMKDYFVDYDTKVTSVTGEEMRELKQEVSHQGEIITLAKNYFGTIDRLETKVVFENNAHATGSILAASAIAAYNKHQQGFVGAVGPGDLERNLYSPSSKQQIWGTGL